MGYRTVELAHRPHCQYGECEELAYFDAKTHYGPWGYFCVPHFAVVGVGYGVDETMLATYLEVVNEGSNT